MQEDPRIYYYYYFFIIILLLFFWFLLSKSQLRSSFIRLLHLHEKFARHEIFSRESLCVCACVCVRAYVCRDCCNINESIEIDTVEWRSRLEIMALKIV